MPRDIVLGIYKPASVGTFDVLHIDDVLSYSTGGRPARAECGTRNSYPLSAGRFDSLRLIRSSSDETCRFVGVAASLLRKDISVLI